MSRAYVPDTDRWCAPDLESDRIWHEPEVLIYNTSIFPEVSSSARGYDVANRRWYELNIDSVIGNDEEEWLSKTITRHITEYQDKHGTMPDFNVINTSRLGLPTTFEQRPNDHIARSIKGNFHYGRGESDILPTTTFDQVKEKVHLSCSSDRCVWEGRDCVFKWIEFVEDLQVMEREVRLREELLRTMQEDPRDARTMDERFRVLPILAVVLKHAETDETLGLLLPYGGTSLETLAGGYKFGMGYQNRPAEEEDEVPVGNEVNEAVGSSQILPITETHFQSLVLAVWELARAGVLHGDINDRNTLLTADGRLVFIDLGDVAPEYQGDAFALGAMMIWALQYVDWDAAAVERVRKIGVSLQKFKDG